MKIMKYMLVALSLLGALFVLFINRNLAGLTDWIYPGSALWAHGVLLFIELLAFLWFWRGLFGRHEHLLLMDAATPETKQRFAEELVRRMRGNPIVRQAELSPEDPAYLDKYLVLLGEKADGEIRQNARRIFLATALSQNGRLDALIVFVALCRQVWRVAAIYNQRPHPREVFSLYWTVVTTTFLALTMEELDVATEITVGFGESFHAMAPAGVTASIPFAGKALQTFTASTIDGTANCYLALRAGIITRNAFAYRAKREEIPGRAAVFREAGALLLELSGGLVDRLARALGGNIAGAARYAQDKTVQAGLSVVDGIGKVGQGIGVSAGKVATDTVSAVQSTGNGLWKAGAYAGNSLGWAAGKTADATWKLLSAPLRMAGNRSRKAPASCVSQEDGTAAAAQDADHSGDPAASASPPEKE